MCRLNLISKTLNSSVNLTLKINNLKMLELFYSKEMPLYKKWEFNLIRLCLLDISMCLFWCQTLFQMILPKAQSLFRELVLIEFCKNLESIMETCQELTISSQRISNWPLKLTKRWNRFLVLTLGLVPIRLSLY